MPITLDTSKLYEWFITESKVVVRQGKTYLSLVSSCVTEDYLIREEYLVDPLTMLSTSLTDRISRTYPNHSKDGQQAQLVLTKGVHYFAKVQALWPTRAVVQELYFTLNPLTYTDHSPSEQQGVSLRERVVGVVALKLSRRDTLSKLEQLGVDYVKEYRKMESEGKV